MKKFAWVPVPIALLALVYYSQAKVAAFQTVPPGGACSATAECMAAAQICTITDKGIWIFGVNGFCTAPCRLDDPASCPSGMVCREGSVTTSRGTKWNFRWEVSSGAYCAPSK